MFAEIYTDADAGVYEVALACDKIYMAEGAMMEIIGPRMVSRPIRDCWTSWACSSTCCAWERARGLMSRLPTRE